MRIPSPNCLSSQFVTMIFESIKSIIVVCSILSESFDARNCDGVQDPVSEYFVVVVRDITDTYFSKFGTTAIFSESWCLSRRPWCESWYQNCLINECSTSVECNGSNKTKKNEILPGKKRKIFHNNSKNMSKLDFLLSRLLCTVCTATKRTTLDESE